MEKKIGMHKYSIEMYIDLIGNGDFEWITDYRYYVQYHELDKSDLKDVPGKRKNATYLGFIENENLPFNTNTSTIKP